MEEEKIDTIPQQGPKMSLELLSKEEVIQKYKGLLAIAKKAKLAKDEISEENRSLKEQLQERETQKEADKKALMTMKEMLEVYTENKLQLTTQVSELQKVHKLDSERLENISIENESLKRQLQRLTEDNESLLTDIENMEGQLKQVSGLVKEHKQNIVSLKKEITKLREIEIKSNEIRMKNDELCKELLELKEKYDFIEDINTEQTHKFNALKDRFIEVHKKMKKLKECKIILLETRHEHADAVSQWQTEIIKASDMLYKQLNDLKEENIKLLQRISSKDEVKESNEKYFVSLQNINELLKLSENAKQDYEELRKENVNLNKSMGIKTGDYSALLSLSNVNKLDEIWQLSKIALQDYSNIQKENVTLRAQGNSKDKGNLLNHDFKSCYISVSKLEELEALAIEASKDYNTQIKEIDKLKQSIEKLQIEINYSKKQKDLITQTSSQNWQSRCDQLEEKIILLEEEKKSLRKKIPEVENMKRHHVSKLPTHKALEDYRNKSKKECENLLEKLASLEKENLQQKETIENITMQLEKVTENKFILKEKINELELEKNSYVSESKKEILAAHQLLEEYQENYKNKEIEHCELLDEMRELNEALKARGDLISRQQEEHQFLTSELKIDSEKLSKIIQEIDNKDIQLNQKQTELESIVKELAMAKHKIETLANANSLNEEKVRILSMELENMKLNPSSISTDFENQSDILSTSTISKSDELQRLKDVEDSFEDKYNKLRGLAAKLKKKLQEETIVRQKLEKDIQYLKKQEKELNCQIVEYKNKICDMDSLHKQLNEKQKFIDTLKSENHKLKSSRKQANVLNLEIEAAEKSLAEVTYKLSNRNSELEAAQDSLKSKDSTIEQLRKEIYILESSKSSEIKHSQELKQHVDQLQKTLKEEMYNKQQAYEKSKLLEQDVENLKLELEKVEAELAQSSSNQEILIKSLNNEREELRLQLSTIQAALINCEQKLKKAEGASEDLRVEYLNYKVKAQAVLRKNQNRDSSKERELEEELLTMRAAETHLNATIETLTLKIESLEKQKDILNDDNASVQKRSQELMILIDDIRAQNDALNQEIQQNIQQQHETLKQHRKQIESIDNCYKEQIQSLNASHQRQLEQERKEMAQHIRLPTAVGATKSTTSLPLHAHIEHSVDQSKLDFLLMEREDAEGSEEAAETLANLATSRKISNDSSSTKRSMQDFMPLDELLNTPLNDINSETLITNTEQHRYGTDSALNAENTTNFLQLELNSTKECLQKQESRVRHLTALLAENEQDLAKLTQMNDMLKEELRRQERSMEREQHMHNSEYVKNVIMKFLTLNNADEKNRLLPVLNTILKLSPSECEMLNCVAKGQKVAETTQRAGGWGNFLSWGNNSNNN